MIDLLLICVAGGIGLATFWLIARKYGSDCIP